MKRTSDSNVRKRPTILLNAKLYVKIFDQGGGLAG